MSKTTVPPDHLLQIVDPLGEIRQHAKELYDKAGSPESKSWKDYWGDAERALMGDAPIETKGDAPAQDIKSKQENALQKSLGKDEDAYLLMVARSFPHGITSHQARCLAIFLSENKIWFRVEHVTRDPIPISQCVTLVSRSCFDYSEDELRHLGVPEVTQLERSVAERFWQKELMELEREDRALDFQQRNTIQRFHKAFSSDPEIKEVIFAG